MKLRGALIIILLTAVLPFLPITSAQSPLVIVPLNNDFSGVPGDTIIVPFKLENLGNQTLENVSVYITGPAEGFLYQSKVIREPIGPNQTYQDTLSIKILNIAPGKYNLTIVARAGSVYSEAPLTVTVKTFVDYDLKIDVGREYPYGSNVSVILRMGSKANGVIIGRIGYTITRDGETVENFVTTIYLNPGEKWVRNVTLSLPPVGDYTVRLWAYFGGKSKSTTATFRVFQRNLGYKAYFENGAIHVFVHDEGDRGVSDISVKINGIPFKTDESGTVSYLVSEPGTYGIVLNLDGRIVTTFVEVKKLFISYEQRNETLLVRVVDSTGKPVPNITVTASGPIGKDYSTTNASGLAAVDLRRTGYGTIILKAESSAYMEASASAKTVEPPRPTPTTTSSPSPTTTTAQPTTTTTPSKPPRDYGPLALILIVSGVLLAGTSYLAFFQHTVQEETLDRYYFVKVKAPRLRGIDNFRFEKGVNAIEARATRGKVEIKDGSVIWEIDHLEPGEEAYLQVILG
ncbi:membrane protein, conserved [Thermococcus sp. 4557]|uniref:COG1470 family protein n=1 Tax=Thermococcus sp. (strain CGMCC 1.5172 / 4557) TaxID=1042877 RepID=UPI000219E7AF|nr:membrane protein [Thermococcus sp. 4557]AEK72577.1 membrane protein, conserved [Thermococcus sp. 4557]